MLLNLRVQVRELLFSLQPVVTGLVSICVQTLKGGVCRLDVGLNFAELGALGFDLAVEVGYISFFRGKLIRLRLSRSDGCTRFG